MTPISALAVTFVTGAIGIPIATRMIRRFGVPLVSAVVVAAMVGFLFLDAALSGGKVEAAQALLVGGLFAHVFGMFLQTFGATAAPVRLLVLGVLVVVSSAASLSGLDRSADVGGPSGDEARPATTAVPDPQPAAVDPTMFSIEPAIEPGVLSAPTAFTFGAPGELYVGTGEGIKRLGDADGDGVFETVEHYALDGAWILGLAYRDDSLYAAHAGRLVRLRGATPAVEVLVDGLPWNRYGNHSNNGIAFGPDGTLFMTLGGTTDHGPELEDAGVILTWNEVDGQVSTFATGLRNPYDLAVCPDGNLYASDNGPDALDAALVYKPPDEINLILQGRDYGYPEFFGNAPAWSGVESPVALLPASGAAAGLLCHSGVGLPNEYSGDLFVALWGTATANIEAGRRLMRVELDAVDGRPSGVAREFAAGFGHPIDLLEDDDGSVLVLDYGPGRIFRITYIGP